MKFSWASFSTEPIVRMASAAEDQADQESKHAHIKITELLRFRMLILVDDLQANQPPKRNMRV